MYVHVHEEGGKDHLLLKWELYFLSNINKMPGEIHTSYVEKHTCLKDFS